jgi:1-phosphatidylinositol phosphodiesterase
VQTINRLEPTITKTSLQPPPQRPENDVSVSPKVASRRPLTISYLSAATLMAPPNILAKGFGWPSIGLGVQGLNDRFTLWLLELMCEGKRIRGIVPVDFYSEVGEVAKLLVIMNQLGYAGEGQNRVEEEARVSGDTLVSVRNKV